MQSATVSTDRQLRAALLRLAAEQLGPRALPEQIRKLAIQWYNGPTRRIRKEETPVQRWKREAEFRSTQDTIRRASG